MPEMTPVLAPWANFYMLTGSAAAALTGLMFVVITLIFGETRSNPTPEGIGTFSTPTVLHFCNVLFVSAILVAPWHTTVIAEPLVGLIGLCGAAYIFRVLFRQMRMTSYKPDLEDWTWFTVAPFFAYAAILAGAILLHVAAGKALFVVGGAVVLLIFIGIRNSWDVVTYMAIRDEDTDTPT